MQKPFHNLNKHRAQLALCTIAHLCLSAIISSPSVAIIVHFICKSIIIHHRPSSSRRRRRLVFSSSCHHLAGWSVGRWPEIAPLLHLRELLLLILLLSLSCRTPSQAGVAQRRRPCQTRRSKETRPGTEAHRSTVQDIWEQDTHR